MDASSMKRLKGARDKSHFIVEMKEMLAPYGSVRRSQLVVERKCLDTAAPCFTEVLCFIEMETPQQAMAAEKGLGLLLLDACYLFFSTRLGKNFAE